MCSSYTTKSKTDKAAYEKNYGKLWLEEDLAIAERYHEPNGDAVGFPGSAMPVITLQKPEVIQAYIFGFTPGWLAPEKLNEQRATFNARIETIPQLATWRDAWKNAQRCIVCTNGFFEYNKREKRRMKIQMKDNECFYYAGLFNNYVNKETGEIHKTMAVVTTVANSLIGEIHNRMPVILSKGMETLWMDKSARLDEILGFYAVPFEAQKLSMAYADDVPPKPSQGSLF